jgi:transglycosylase-like protein with SLT domain
MLTEAANTTRNDVLAALHQASAATGSDFQFLLGTAMRESGLKPQAKSSTSSASGLFQFVDQTWLGLVKQHGAQYGLGSYAGAISQDADGHYSVDNQSDRQAILALRNNPQVASLMEGEFANEARTSLQSALGRNVCNGELYAAHFLGPESACRLIRLTQSQPESSAPAAFPQAAGANKSVFYHADGAPKSVREVYDWALKQTNGAEPSEGYGDASRMAAKSSFRFAPTSGTGNSWIASELFAATDPDGSMSSLSQAPFLSPDVIDMLGTLSIPGGTNQNHAHGGA